MRSSHLILCADTTDDVTGAAERLQNKHGEADCPILHLDHKKVALMPDSVIEAHKINQTNTKIYIVSHGLPGQIKLTENIEFWQLANLIAQLTSQPTIALISNPARISFVACHSGARSKDGTQPSMAEQLHSELLLRGCYTEITARMSTTSIVSSGRKVTLSMKVLPLYMALYEELKNTSRWRVLRRRQLSKAMSKIHIANVLAHEPRSKILVSHDKGVTPIIGTPHTPTAEAKTATQKLKAAWLPLVIADKETESCRLYYSLLIQVLEKQRLVSRADIRSTLTCAANWFRPESHFRVALKQTIFELDATPSP